MTKVIVTLGPATNSLEHVQMIKSKGVDFVRINMSHSTLDDLEYYIDLSKKADIPFIIDTEGSQVRTGDLSSDSYYYEENDRILLHKQNLIGDGKNISIRPWQILEQLNEGDILYVDFDTLVLRINDISNILNAGADKVCINTALINDPNLIYEAARIFDNF